MAEKHGLFETLSHFALGTMDTATQIGAFFGIVDNKKATAAYLAKVVEEGMSGRIDKKTMLADAINAFTDYEVTKKLEAKGYSPEIAKAAGWITSALAGKLAHGIENKIFKSTDSMEQVQGKIEAFEALKNGSKAPPGMLADMKDVFGPMAGALGRA